MDGILDHDRSPGIGVLHLGGMQEDVGSRLRPAVRQVLRGEDVRCEHVVEPGAAEHRLETVRGRVRADAAGKRDARHRTRDALDRPHVPRQPLVEHAFRPVEQRGRQRNGRFPFHREQDVLPAQPGEAFGEAERIDGIAGLGQEPGLDLRPR